MKDRGGVEIVRNGWCNGVKTGWGDVKLGFSDFSKIIHYSKTTRPHSTLTSFDRNKDQPSGKQHVHECSPFDRVKGRKVRKGEFDETTRPILLQIPTLSLGTSSFAQSGMEGREGALITFNRCLSMVADAGD